MKTKTLVAAVTFSSLLTLGGTSYAGDNAQDGYNRGTTPQSEGTGKGAHGSPGNTSAGSVGHDAYNRSLVGTTPKQPQQNAYNRGSMSTTNPQSEVMGKGDHGSPGNTSAWTAGHDAYNRSLVGTTPNKPQVDYMGKAAYGTGSSSIEGKAAYGTSSSSNDGKPAYGSSSSFNDGNVAYRSSFHGD